MSKLFTVFAFLALISVATARTYTTVITTTEEEKPHTSKESSSTCTLRKRLIPEEISHCRMWLETQGGKEHLTPCCTQLSKVNSQCRCEMIKTMWGEMMQDMQKKQHYGGGPQSMEQMMGMAEMLPGMFCKMDSPKHCSLSTITSPYY